MADEGEILTAEEQRTRDEARAREANAQDLWNRLWLQEGQSEWREAALSQVHTRIERQLPEGQDVIDVGGGPGYLAARLRETRKASATVWDHSTTALAQAIDKGVYARQVDLEIAPALPHAAFGSYFVGTEILEHLSARARKRLLTYVAVCVGPHENPFVEGGAFFSVPNHRLGPEEEHQHTIEYTAVTFAAELREHFGCVRVEALGPYLLGVCGAPARKGFTLSVCLPVRDEAQDLERTLASFRGVADEIVVGIDPRTEDDTAAIAARYADVIFELQDLHGPPGEEVPDGGFHFAHARNQCMDRCSGDWIFMTEGHEHLAAGHDVLLQLEQVMPQQAEIGFVVRAGEVAPGWRQRWAFPWLCRNKPEFRYKRSTHNILDYSKDTPCVQMPQVMTFHQRHEQNAKARVVQRKIQNRETLLDDWELNENSNSLFYLAQELRGDDDPAKAIGRFEEFLALPPANGEARYQARLMLAKLYVGQDDAAGARRTLMRCQEDDWSRTEHWIWLGDLAYQAEQFEEALRFYLYGATTIGEPPFTMWWIDLPKYSFHAAQRLAQTYGQLNRPYDALVWAKKVLEFLPDNAPPEFFEETRRNIRVIKEVIVEAGMELPAGETLEPVPAG